MKKYLIISLSSITLAIILITQLYKNTDIDFVDSIVENTTEALGISPEFVEKKVERKKEEEVKRTEALVKPIEVPQETQANPEILALNKQRMEDSIARVQAEAKKKKLFNVQVDETAINKIKEEARLAEEKRKADSLALATAPKKKPLFNAVVSEQTSAASSASNTKLEFFEAKVHGSQKFNDNQEVLFRTAKPVTIQGKTVPENFVFKAKANVFDGKVSFVLKSINDLQVSGENYHNNHPGIPITSELKLGTDYILSDGAVMRFGVKL